MFDWFKKKLKPTTVEEVVKKPKPRKKKELSEKEKATVSGEPYVSIVRIDLDPESLHEGSFELDWNEKFVANLIRAGYQMSPADTDADIVDRWFTNLCRHVVLETFEQYEAMNPNSTRTIRSRDIGDGRSEVS
jgi:hypothetical protein